MEYTPPLTRSQTTFELDRASELSDLPPLFAIPNLIPCHRLSLIVAPSGGGLTALACTLAASLAPTLPHFLEPNELISPSPTPPISPSSSAPSSSAPASSAPASLHDSPTPSVLLITDRDNPDVLKPRLQALGADLHRILILSKVYHHHPSPDGYIPPMDTAEPFSPLDHNELSETLHEHRGIRLVLIDNAELLFSDFNRPSRSRIQRQLALLQAVANKREVAIVLLTSIPRLCSDPFRGALLCTFRDTARMVYLLAPDLDDPAAHLLFNLKNTLPLPIPNLRLNLFAAKPSLSAEPSLSSDSARCYRIINNHYPLTYPHYLHQRQHPATRGPDPLAHDYTAEVLVELLSHGPMPAGHKDNPDPNTLYQQTRLAGLSWRTVQRVKKALQITSTKEADHWLWRLPPTISAIHNPESRIQNSPSASSPTLAIAPSEETWRSSPPDDAQLLIPSAPTAQRDTCATPTDLPPNSDSTDFSSRLGDAVQSPQRPAAVSPGVAA